MNPTEVSGGIFARLAPGEGARLLSAALPSRGCRLLGQDERRGGSEHHAEAVLATHGDGWCRVRVQGNQEAEHHVVISLVESAREVVTFRNEPSRWEFSYVHYRAGEPVESFSYGGHAMGTVRFTSETRKVPLTSILEPRRFVADALSSLGLARAAFERGEDEHLVLFRLPRSGGLLSAVLGAAWPGR